VTAVTDEAWALWPELARLSDGDLDMLALVVRTSLDPGARVALDAAAAGTTGRLRARSDLRAIERLAPDVGLAALAIWIAAARRRLDAGFDQRLDDRRSALHAPGRDPTLHFVAEKAKVDVRDDLVPIDWLDRGVVAARSVGFMHVRKYIAGALAGEVVGTGFAVARDGRHVMTAYHVVEARDRTEERASPADLERQVREATIAFDYTTGTAGRGTPLAIAELVAGDPVLDYAIVRLAQPTGLAPLALFPGALPRVDGGVGFVANIVQHPMRELAPQPKQLGLRNNAVWRVDADRLYYFTDTRGGSSGSPVFSDGWKVIAVHAGYDPFRDAIYLGRNQGFANRGIRVGAILAHARPALEARGVELVVDQQAAPG